jgi:hypothetical protein
MKNAHKGFKVRVNVINACSNARENLEPARQKKKRKKKKKEKEAYCCPASIKTEQRK